MCRIGFWRGAEPGDGGDEHHRLEPRRQLPRDDVAGADAALGQRGGHPLAPVAVLGERHPPAALVDGHLGVGRRRRPRFSTSSHSVAPSSMSVASSIRT